MTNKDASSRGTNSGKPATAGQDAPDGQGTGSPVSHPLTDYGLILMPFLSYTSILFGYGLIQTTTANRLMISPGRYYGLAGLGWMFVGAALLWLLLHLRMCFKGRPSLRGKARFSLAVSLVLAAIFLAVTEKRLQTPVKYRSFQMGLQRVLENRSKVTTTEYRGIQIQASYNRFGWPDAERSFEKSGTRIVCIGDSFLEIRSTRNAARRLEERLRTFMEDVEVINLSATGTGPDGYRHRLYEIAFDYQPDHVIIFLYGGNDLKYTYRYKKYRYHRFGVTEEALNFLERSGVVPDTVLETLRDDMRRSVHFDSKADVMARFERFGMTLEQKNFIYLALYAYTSRKYDRSSHPVLDNTLRTIERLWHPLVTGRQAHATRDRNGDWQMAQEEYLAAFDLPPESRAGGIAAAAATQFGADEPRPYRDALDRLDPGFLQEMTAFADDPSYVFAALHQAVTNPPPPGDPGKRKLRFVVQGFVRLLDEMREAATARDCMLHVVLIPEASQADRSFRQAWLPLCDFQVKFAREHILHDRVARELEPSWPFLDLRRFADELDGGYWIFDGHWNERGNENVAAILESYLRPYLPVPEEENWGQSPLF